jgi:hypothetical protein
VSQELFEDFWINKLVFIGSASSANVVIPMSVAGLLMGRNNVGKTSSISALKLFVLPEVNFKNCKEKFGFKSNGEFHDAADSSSYYFPSDRSFIICEAQNHKGTFCTILHRSNEEWGYARIMVSASYENIQHLFWDYDGQSNAGSGKNLPSLSLKEVKDGLKPFSPTYLTKTAEIKEAIYVRPGPLNDLSRYCLIPMPNKGDQKEVESLRSLLSLAFNISGSNMLTGAIASIIESENTGKKRTPSVDILEINDEYNELKAQGKLLATIRSNQPVWEDFKKSYDEYNKKSQSFKKNLSILLGHEYSIKQRFQKLSDHSNSKFEDISKQEIEAKRIFQSDKKDHDAIEAYLKEKVATITEKRKEIGIADELYGQHKMLDEVSNHKELSVYLSNQLPGIRDDIQACESEEKAKEQLQSLTEEAGELSQKLAELRELKRNDRHSTLESLGSHEKTVLFSLNNALGQTTSVTTDDQKESITQFANLFELGEGRLSFLDEPLRDVFIETYNPETERLRRDDQINTAAENHAGLLARIAAINSSYRSAKGDNTELLELKEELQKYEAGLLIIESYDYITNEIEKLVTGIDKAQEELPIASSKKGESELNFKMLKEKKESVTLEAKEYGKQLAALEVVTGRVHFAKQQLGSEIQDASLVDNIAMIASGGDINLDGFTGLVEEFTSLCTSINDRKKILASSLKKLIREKVLTNQSSIDYDTELAIDDVHKYYEQLRAVFENYDGNKKKYHTDIEAHNNSTGTRSAAITEIGDMINDFRKSINKELAEYKISNLISVELEIEVDPRFSAIMDDIHRTSFAGNNLLNESVYERLNNFCDEFFRNVSGQKRYIEIDRVIKKVKYKANVGDKKKDKNQSNGTSIMINTALLTLLLKRMIPAGIKLHFPIIVDEVLNLDRVNLRTVKKMVEENNFILFVVCPENAGTIASEISTWYDLSLHSVTDGYIVPLCDVIHFDNAESLIYQEQQNNSVDTERLQ